MPELSPLGLAKRIQADVLRALAVDAELDNATKTALAALKRNAADMRLDVRDYELAETRSEQELLAKAAKERLAATQQGILLASQHNIFGTVEVAHISAQIAQLHERLV